MAGGCSRSTLVRASEQLYRCTCVSYGCLGTLLGYQDLKQKRYNQHQRDDELLKLHSSCSSSSAQQTEAEVLSTAHSSSQLGQRAEDNTAHSRSNTSPADHTDSPTDIPTDTPATRISP
ncbi:hypothetical protein FS749_013600 [Ceratobasidium sp. UAMH 11750]|nr:hypothetical protein FS749_013600 [Ceratobasidium sp. UAMH 11750]